MPWTGFLSRHGDQAVHSDLKQRVCESSGNLPVIEGSNAQTANVELAGIASTLVAGHLQLAGATRSSLRPYHHTRQAFVLLQKSARRFTACDAVTENHKQLKLSCMLANNCYSVAVVLCQLVPVHRKCRYQASPRQSPTLHHTYRGHLHLAAAWWAPVPAESSSCCSPCISTNPCGLCAPLIGQTVVHCNAAK